MPTVVGIFERREDAERAVDDLDRIGLSREAVSLLTPDLDTRRRQEIPQQQGEQPGIVKGISAVTGGVIGLTAATLLLPGVGPIVAIGMAGGAVIGGLAGGAVGGKLEEIIFPGIPEQELFLYEDALRKGRTGLIAFATDKKQAEAARGILQYQGAESIDRARHMWWLGVREVEKEHYAPIGDFAGDEPYFRQGFEDALLPRNRNKSPEEYLETLGGAAPELALPLEARRRGFERGRAYLQAQQRAA